MWFHIYCRRRQDGKKWLASASQRFLSACATQRRLNFWCWWHQSHLCSTFFSPVSLSLSLFIQIVSVFTLKNDLLQIGSYIEKIRASRRAALAWTRLRYVCVSVCKCWIRATSGISKCTRYEKYNNILQRSLNALKLVLPCVNFSFALFNRNPSKTECLRSPLRWALKRLTRTTTKAAFKCTTRNMYNYADNQVHTFKWRKIQ